MARRCPSRRTTSSRPIRAHVGAAVAFVIADTVAAVKDAVEKVIVEYEPLAAVIDALAAVELRVPRLYNDLPNIMIDAEVGDAKATAEAFARAAHVTRLDTWINRVAGVPMEPRAAGRCRSKLCR
jgi:aerobic carbon-monoxide dehydrogenase large subunit